MPWRQLSLLCDQDTATDISPWLELAGAVAITYLDAADTPILEPALDRITLWDAVKLLALFPLEIAIPDVERVLTDKLANKPDMLRSACWEEIADEDWSRRWMQDWENRCFGDKLWVVPHHCDVPAEAEIVLCLDPGLAFGTGTHETTALCLEWLASHDVTQQQIIDYGCGSGILALAALKLGAQTVTAIDHDPQALIATEENARVNDISDTQLQCLTPEIPLDRQVDTVLANILAQPLLDLAPRFISHLKPGGQLVMSGILNEQIAAICDRYAIHFRQLHTQILGDWALVWGEDFLG